MSGEKPVRVALLGYGHGGSVFHAPLIDATPGMTLAAVVTNAPERRARVAREFPDTALLASADDVWRDAASYDLVVVATPNRTHVPLALTAMHAGLPVVVDKPMAATVADAERLLEASRKTGQMLSVFQNARWSSTFLTVRQILADGLLGPVIRFEARLERYRPEPRAGAWRERGAPEEAGGLLYDFGSHLIDQALVLFGRPRRVYAELAHHRLHTEVDDDTFVAIEFEHGIHANLWMSYLARAPGPAVRVWGLHGVYEKLTGDPQEDALRQGRRPTGPEWGTEPRERWGRLTTSVASLQVDGLVESVPGNYLGYYAAMRDALSSGGPPPVDPRDVVQTLRVIEAAQRSAREHIIVEM
jgi:scyllo-inositol 2-dehydrogenase (NADP+)